MPQHRPVVRVSSKEDEVGHPICVGISMKEPRGLLEAQSGIGVYRPSTSTSSWVREPETSPEDLDGGAVADLTPYQQARRPHRRRGLGPPLPSRHRRCCSSTAASWCVRRRVSSAGPNTTRDGPAGLHEPNREVDLSVSVHIDNCGLRVRCHRQRAHGRVQAVGSVARTTIFGRKALVVGAPVHIISMSSQSSASRNTKGSSGSQ